MSVCAKILKKQFFPDFELIKNECDRDERNQHRLHRLDKLVELINHNTKQSFSLNGVEKDVRKYGSEAYYIVFEKDNMDILAGRPELDRLRIRSVIQLKEQYDIIFQAGWDIRTMLYSRNIYFLNHLPSGNIPCPFNCPYPFINFKMW